MIAEIDSRGAGGYIAYVFIEKSALSSDSGRLLCLCSETKIGAPQFGDFIANDNENGSHRWGYGYIAFRRGLICRDGSDLF